MLFDLTDDHEVDPLEHLDEYYSWNLENKAIVLMQPPCQGPLVPMRLTYAIAPPNQATALERRRSIAAAQSALASSLPIDALLVYDVQDEAARNGSPRPFAFMPKVDPLTYALDELQVGALPLVVYHAVAQQDDRSFCRWLDRIEARRACGVLVGAPSRRASSLLSLPEALSVCRARAPNVPIGGVVIPERHRQSGGEDARVWAKMQRGCSFFVSQTVWSRAATRQLLHDLRIRADRERAEVPTLLFTLSPCGSQQTLEFLEWLGVDVPSSMKVELRSAKDMLARSIELAVETYAEVRAFALSLGFAVGCNVESVSSRASEVEASVELIRRIDQLDQRSLKQAAEKVSSAATAAKVTRADPPFTLPAPKE